jgi:hypothetical protein
MKKTEQTTTDASAATLGQRFIDYLQDPLGSIIVASVTTIGSFGVVLSGIWFVNLAVS